MKKLDFYKMDTYTQEEKKELLALARQTLQNYFATSQILEPNIINKKFKEFRGVFVTLNKSGRLRGCIGNLEPSLPLAKAIQSNVLAAAFDDNRFLPLEPDEMEKIKIEISILTLPKADLPENIFRLKRGAILRRGNHQATYLPQVWAELPDFNLFFSTLCQKAGLPGDCWQKTGTEISSYQAEVFSE